MALSMDASPSRAEKSAMSAVLLIPWDADSAAHVERMLQQRIACGWNKEAVESWRALQGQGKMAIQWITLSDSDPTRETKLNKHQLDFPLEVPPLSDTAISFGGKPREPSFSPRSFHPVGHISLDSVHDGEALPIGVYKISTFYVSASLQGSGLGRAAMDAVESMAINEPLCAKTLKLGTIANEFEGKQERLKALGNKPPKVSNEDWYSRRGYTVYNRRDHAYFDTDSTGRQWSATEVQMKKDIR